MDLTGVEILILVPLIGLAVGSIVHALFQSPAELWSPRVLYAALMLYYMIIGPLMFVAYDQTVFLRVDYRSIFWKGWLAALIAYGSFLVAYALTPQPKPRKVVVVDDPRLLNATYILGAISFICMFMWAMLSGLGLSILNPLSANSAFAAETAGSTNPFVAYFLYLGNLIIPGMVLLLLIWLETRMLLVLLVLVGVFMLAMAFYINTGFRFRIAWTVIALQSAYYLWRRKRPNMLLLGIAGILFLMTMGLIGMTRNYFSGLSLERASGASAQEVMLSGFSEAGIFFSNCAVVDAVPERFPNTYFDPLIVTAAFPIPSKLWPDKPRSETLFIMAASFQAEGANGAGQAVPYFGEWYVAFGWPGLIGSSLLLGYGAKKLWFWYCDRMQDKLVTGIYCVCLGFLYVLFGRGYLPQTTMNFCFTILPLILIHRHFARKSAIGSVRFETLGNVR